jgi:hypothetical protein
VNNTIPSYDNPPLTDLVVREGFLTVEILFLVVEESSSRKRVFAGKSEKLSESSLSQ